MLFMSSCQGSFPTYPFPAVKQQWLKTDNSETEGEWNSRIKAKEHRGLALVAQRAGEAGQTLTVARDVVARPGAVHTLWAWLAAAVPVEPRRADWSRESVAGEEGLNRQCEWNKKNIIMKEGKTRVIKGEQKNQGQRNYRRINEERQQRKKESRKKEKSVFIAITPISYAARNGIVKELRESWESVLYKFLSKESSLTIYKCHEKHNCAMVMLILLKGCEALRNIQKVAQR